MASISNPKKPKGYNAYMTAAGWGTLYCKVITIGHGMSVVSSGVKSRRGRVLYVTRRTSGSFGASFMCTSYAEYKAFGEWIQGYGERLAARAPQVGPVRLVCPDRNFDKVAIPNGVSFGDTSESHVYPISINFLGSRDPIPLTNNFVSAFRLPKGSDDPSLPYYYPGGTQLTGGQTGVDSLFDVPPPPITSVTPTPVPGPWKDPYNVPPPNPLIDPSRWGR